MKCRQLAATIAFSGLASASAAQTAMTVAKDPSCGCCAAWAEIVQTAGYAVTIESTSYDTLKDLKASRSIPDTMAGCHTATIEGYTIEGHVPAADIDRLLTERPDAIGLAVPGMPIGSPGMEPSRDAYDVILIGSDGETEVFASYSAR